MEETKELRLIRANIIKEILDIFGVFNKSIIFPLRDGESLAEYLKRFTVIYPEEYDSFLSGSCNDIVGFANILNNIIEKVESKKRIYNLFREYCRCFLGEIIYAPSLDPSFVDESFKSLDLRDQTGHIDYVPYLEILGITDIQHISEQYSGRGR